MRNYVLGRVLMLIPTLLVASVLTFVLLRIAPGDAAVARAGLAATEENVAEIRAELGLDRPFFPIYLSSSAPFVNFTTDNQFTDWLGGVLIFDFGESSTYNTPVRRGDHRPPACDVRTRVSQHAAHDRDRSAGRNPLSHSPEHAD